MRCLVTGATGFLGSYLVRFLLEKDADVAVLLRKNSNTWRIDDVLHRTSVIHGDLENIRESEKEIEKFSPEVVFHLAWFGVGSSDRDDIRQITTNLCGTLALFETVKNIGCKRFVGLGSQAEYGLHEGIIHNDLPTKPVTMYGAAKLSTCILTKRLCEMHGISWTWMRLAASYGPKDDINHLIPYVILRLLRGEKPSFTQGEQRWDYLYVTDAVKAIYLAGIMPEVQGILNLGSGEAPTVRAITELIRDFIDTNVSLKFGELDYREDHVMLLQVDISTLKDKANWSPTTGIMEGIKHTVEWYKENRDYE